MQQQLLRRQAISLVGLRVYAGLVWLAYGTSKFEGNWAGGKHEFLSAVKYSAAATTEPFRSFLVNVVVPHQGLFAQLIAVGETLVGVSLVLGLLTKLGAAGGMFLSANYYTATGRFSFDIGVESIELLLFILSLYLIVTTSARDLSLDRYFTNRKAAGRVRSTVRT
jgi:uncharacterized membrane protein YphA (DoxX/SURF4 family)